MLGYLAIATLACSIGFVLGGVLASNRNATLLDRLALTERALAEQAALTNELSEAMRKLLADLDERADGGGGDVVDTARVVLGRSEGTAAELRPSSPASAKEQTH